MKGVKVGPEEIRDQAAVWLVRWQAGLKPAEEQEFQVWCDADERHRAAWTEIGSAWSVVSAPARSGQAKEAIGRLRFRHERRIRQRKSVFTRVGLATVGMLIFTLLLRPGDVVTPNGRSTVALRPDRQVLSDGSTVELNAGSEIETTYTDMHRKVRLVSGEALFTVVPDRARPFVVIAGGVEVRAVGTAFSVRLNSREVDVLVTHGKVAVADGDGPSVPSGPLDEDAAVVLSAGYRVQVSRAQLPPLRPPVVKVTVPEMDSALAWREKRIELTHTSLVEVFEIFNRENRVKLVVGDSATGEIHLSGIFWVDDPEGLVRLVEKGFGLRVDRTGETIRLRQR